MRVWRLCRRPFVKDPLGGKGGLHASGRWHTAPRVVVYTSESLALASLEVLVHVDFDLGPLDLVAVEIIIRPEIRISEINSAKLPKSWCKYPAPRALQKLGNDWLDSKSSAVLRVPSAVIPGEYTFLINPLHADVRRISVKSRSSFAFDPRLVPPSRKGSPT